jgi:hypothetical protein
MSEIYSKRLRNIFDEYNASKIALSVAFIHFDSPTVSRSIGDVTKHQIKASIDHLDNTFIVRLFAEFEGILKDHLKDNSLLPKDEKNVKIDYLISKVYRLEKKTMDPKLRSKFEDLRAYRNGIAHRNSSSFAPIKMEIALNILVKLTIFLPDPR